MSSVASKALANVNEIHFSVGYSPPSSKKLSKKSGIKTNTSKARFVERVEAKRSNGNAIRRSSNLQGVQRNKRTNKVAQLRKKTEEEAVKTEVQTYYFSVGGSSPAASSKSKKKAAKIAGSRRTSRIAKYLHGRRHNVNRKGQNTRRKIKRTAIVNERRAEYTNMYHEKQQESLCGLHALNNSLQSEMFNDKELHQVAEELDEKERQILGITSSDDSSTSSSSSDNHDERGNFSKAVLEAALKPFDIELPSVQSEEYRNTDRKEFVAFICHKNSHYFAISKIGSRYYNLDSLLQSPIPISRNDISDVIDLILMDGGNVYCLVQSDQQQQ